MAPAIFNEKISTEAGAWLARLQAGALSAQDEAAFRLWLASDPAHAAAFEHATSIWEQLGAIPRGMYVPKRHAASVLDRRALLVGAAGIVVFGSSIPFWGGAQAQKYRTMVGEQRRISLTDGSALFLDTDTSLTVDQGRNRCLVDLQYGRLNCRVVQNERSFAVKAGDRLIDANRSMFDVLNSPDYFSVVLIDGHAEVRSSGSAAIELRQGDRAMAPRAKSLRRDRPDLSILTAWHTGRLIFKDETVSDAVEEVNRYSTVKIEVDDPNVASLRMSGGYVVGDTLGFAESLSQLLPIEVRAMDGKIKLVAKSDI